MAVIIRTAVASDIPAMHRVRLAVTENRLTSNITEASYVSAIAEPGCGWVAIEGGIVIGFAVGNGATGNIWALFVDPDHEGLGIGRHLHDAMVRWLFGGGLPRLHLGTGAGTRAEVFYRQAGWRRTGLSSDGEVEFELRVSDFKRRPV